MEDNTTTQETLETAPQGQPDPNAGLVEARDRYRGERDTAREELTAANARIEQLQRTEVERLASEHLAMPGDFWLSGNGIQDYLDESGSVDPARVAEDVHLLLTERPGLGQFPRAGYDPSQGQGGIPRVTAAEPTFADIFRAGATGTRKGGFLLSG